MKKIIFSAVLIYILIAVGDAAFASPQKIALVINGVLNAGDSGFNDICVSGLNTAKTRYGKKIIVTVYNASKANERLQLVLDEAAKNSDLIIVTAPEFADAMPSVVKKYPQVKIVAFDHMGTDGIKTVLFREEEGGFLAGAMAAMLTKRENFSRMNPEGKIGLLLGKDVPAIQRFKKGYIAGAWYVDPSVTVLCDYTDDFTNFGKGRDIAVQLYDKGADIIFTAAGASGLGAIHQAASSGYWIIGVDTEQETIFPNAVLTSVVKHSGRVVYDIVDRYMKGTLDDEDLSLGITDGCIDLSTWTRESKQNVPSDVRDDLDKIHEKIVKGLIIIK